MSFLDSLGIGLLFCFLLMTVSWLISVKLNFYSLVDAVWAYGIGALAIIFATLSEGAIEKKILVIVLSLLWSLRLGTHLFLRLKQHYPTEDRRYNDLKAKWGNTKFFLFFQFQGLSQVIFSLPFLFIANDRAVGITTFMSIGFVIFLFGFVGEAIADSQLSRFRRRSESRSRVCNEGLWKYSRHPNYFFEWLIWCGISICALSSPYGYIGILSPVLMYLTLNFITGIPATEEQSLKSKGDLYREYQKTTNRFFPGTNK